MYKCKQCGETNRTKMMNKGQGRKCKSLCKACHNRNNTARGNLNKRKAVEHKGGKCQVCGYNKSLAALEFHHIDPTQKDPSWKSNRYWRFKRLILELENCVLLCSNCHKETHNPGMGL